MNRFTALGIQTSATRTIVLTILGSIGGSELQLRTDAIQVALPAHELDFKPMVRVARMRIAIKPVGALISAVTTFGADAIFDHQIQEAVVVIIAPSDASPNGSHGNSSTRGHVGKGPVAVVVEQRVRRFGNQATQTGSHDIHVAVVVVVSPCTIGAANVRQSR